MLLLVVEDRHAAAALGRALALARDRSAAAVVLTADALFAMKLRRDGVDARLTIDGLTAEAAANENPVLTKRDGVALEGVKAALGTYSTFDGTDFAPYVEYTLIPSFVRAVRNVTAVEDQLAAGHADGIVLAGTGALVDAAQLVASHRGLPVEQIAGDPLTRIRLAGARLRAGRATRWVNTEFRAFVLEPGFAAVLFIKGVWRRLWQPAPALRPDAIVVVGDRFTADVIAQLRESSRQIVLAGSTQPGRASFDSTEQVVPIECLVRWTDGLSIVATMISAAVRAVSLATDRAHGRQFVAGACGVCYWPLVRRGAALHILIWVQKLGQVQRLAARAAQAAPLGRLLTSNDVTAYNHILVETVQRFGITAIGIQHGMTGEPNGHSIVHVDTLATWGTETEQWYRGLAPQRARFLVTGSPRFDRTLATRQTSVGSQQPGVHSRQSPGPFTICICTGFMSDFSVGSSEYENLAMIDHVLGWAKGKGSVRVIHKMHPGEEPEYYAEAARALEWDPLTLTTIREPRLYEILDQSDVLVSAYSSTVLESLALGTPAIVFDGMVRRKLLHGDGYTHLEDVPGVEVAYSTGELTRCLDARQAAPPPHRAGLRASAQLREYLSGLDGEASARVAALLR
jgi:hypothetical protein